MKIDRVFSWAIFAFFFLNFLSNRQAHAMPSPFQELGDVIVVPIGLEDLPQETIGLVALHLVDPVNFDDQGFCEKKQRLESMLNLLQTNKSFREKFLKYILSQLVEQYSQAREKIISKQALDTMSPEQLLREFKAVFDYKKYAGNYYLAMIKEMSHTLQISMRELERTSPLKHTIVWVVITLVLSSPAYLPVGNRVIIEKLCHGITAYFCKKLSIDDRVSIYILWSVMELAPVFFKV